MADGLGECEKIGMFGLAREGYVLRTTRCIRCKSKMVTRLTADICRTCAGQRFIHNVLTRGRVYREEFKTHLWHVDATGWLLKINTAWTTFTGRHVDDCLGAGWVTSVHPGDRELTHTWFFEALAAQKSGVIEARLRRADGEYRTMLCHIAPTWRAGEFDGYDGTSVDVTDLKKVLTA